jgi:hypothetical protein
MKCTTSGAGAFHSFEASEFTSGLINVVFVLQSFFLCNVIVTIICLLFFFVWPLYCLCFLDWTIIFTFWYLQTFLNMLTLFFKISSCVHTATLQTAKRYLLSGSLWIKQIVSYRHPDVFFNHIFTRRFAKSS